MSRRYFELCHNGYKVGAAASKHPANPAAAKHADKYVFSVSLLFLKKSATQKGTLRLIL